MTTRNCEYCTNREEMYCKFWHSEIPQKVLEATDNNKDNPYVKEDGTCKGYKDD